MKRSPSHLIEALEAIEKHEGWRIMKEQMQTELNVLTAQLSSPSPKTQAELDWKRGAIFAATQLLDLPARLKTKIRNDAILAKATARTTRPATAGQKGLLP